MYLNKDVKKTFEKSKLHIKKWGSLNKSDGMISNYSCGNSVTCQENGELYFGSNRPLDTEHQLFFAKEKLMDVHTAI